MGVFYFEDKELPEYQNTDANKILKVDTDGVFLQWLEDTKELPTNAVFTTTAFNNGLTTSNGVNMMTLNQNGPSNFNTFTVDIPSILTPTTNTTIDMPGTAFNAFASAFNENNGVCVVTNSTTLAGEPRLYVSEPNNYTTWTPIILAPSNTRSVDFGNNVWAMCGSASAQKQQLFYTTDLTAKTGWTQVEDSAPWSTARSINRMKFLNGQFVTLDTETNIRVSTDCITWSEVKIFTGVNYSLSDVAYSPQLSRYVITSTTGGILYYNGTSLPTTGSNMFTVVSNAKILAVAWSTKLGLFVAVPFNTNISCVSSDGINWTEINVPFVYVRTVLWVDDFGGFFIVTPLQTPNNCFISRNGFDWTAAPLSFSAHGNSVSYNIVNKTFMFGGTDIVHFKNVSSLFNSFVDPDTVYNTFNSKTRFGSTIEYQPQVITTVTNSNQYMLNSFNGNTIEFDTTNEEGIIRIPGASFNGKVGMKYRITKTRSSNYGLKIRAYENCRLRSPFENVLNWNPNSPTPTYNLIPAGNFGSFDLTRVDDNTDGTWTGTWLVDNLNVFKGTLGGTSIKNLETTGDYRSQGDILVNGNIKGLGAGSGTFSFANGTVPTVTSLNISNQGTASTPTLTFGDGVTEPSGLYANPTDNSINISTNGVERMLINNNGISVTGNISVTGSISGPFSPNPLNLISGPRATYRIIDNQTWTVNANIEPVLILSRSIVPGAVNARLEVPLPSTLPHGLNFRVYIFTLPGRNLSPTNSVEIEFLNSTNNALLLDLSGDIKFFQGNLVYTWNPTSTNYTLLDFYNLRDWQTNSSRWLVTPIGRWQTPSPALNVWAGQNN